jgi:hypothetical protein
MLKCSRTLQVAGVLDFSLFTQWVIHNAPEKPGRLRVFIKIIAQFKLNLISIFDFCQDKGETHGSLNLNIRFHLLALQEVL